MAGTGSWPEPHPVLVWRRAGEGGREGGREGGGGEGGGEEGGGGGRRKRRRYGERVNKRRAKEVVESKAGKGRTVRMTHFGFQDV